MAVVMSWGRWAASSSLPGLTVHDSAPGPVVKSGNLVGKARPRGMAVWEREAGKGLRGAAPPPHPPGRHRARPAGSTPLALGWPLPAACL